MNQFDEREDPLESLSDIISVVTQNIESNQGLDSEQLVQFCEGLERIRTSLEEANAQNLLAQTGIIIDVDEDNDKAIVASAGSSRYEVDVHRFPDAQRQVGQKVIVIPDYTFRTPVSRYQGHYQSKVGPVGHIIKVLSDERGLARFQLSEGIVVGATAELTLAAPQPGDLVRYDPEQQLAFELIVDDRIQRVGHAGLVTHMLPGTPPRLQLAYGAGEAFIVEATSELLEENVQVGDWVNFDVNTRLAFQKTKMPLDASGHIGEVVDIYITWHSDGVRTRRLHVNVGGGQDLLLYISPQIENEEFSVGDMVRLDLEALLVLEKLKAYDLSEVRPEEIGDIPYDRIGGLRDAVLDIRKSIEWPYLFPDVYRTYSLRGTKGILLYGPPGNGKTLIAKAIASNLREQIVKELYKPQIQQHLHNLIQALHLHKSLLQGDESEELLFEEWDALFARLPEVMQWHLRHTRSVEPQTREEQLHHEIKEFLLTSDVANLDSPEAEIGKIWELCMSDAHGNPKAPRACYAL